METMKTYIELQQKVLSSILEQNKSQQFVNDTELEFNQFKSWKILATGSSANAITTAKYYIQQLLNVEVEIIEPFNFVHYQTPIDPTALYIAVSQSGRSASTVDATNYVQAKTQNIVVVSSDLSSPICQLTENVVDIGCGQEKVGFVTVGFSSTVITLQLLALNIGVKIGMVNEALYKQELTEFESVVNKVDQVIEASHTWYQENQPQLVQANKIVTIGYGAGYGVSREAETKITETVRCAMNGYELEEYMHGPYLSLNADTYVISLQTANQLEARSQLLIEYIADYTEHCYQISYKNQTHNIKQLGLDTEVSEHKSALLFVIPIQILSYRLAADKGIDLSVRVFDDFDKVLKSKI